MVGDEFAVFTRVPRVPRREMIELTSDVEGPEVDWLRDLREGRELAGSKDCVFGGVCLVASPSCYEQGVSHVLLESKTHTIARAHSRIRRGVRDNCVPSAQT